MPDSLDPASLSSAAPFEGPWVHEVNPDILRHDARWDEGRAESLRQQAEDLCERAARFAATAAAKRERAVEVEAEERDRSDA